MDSVESVEAWRRSHQNIAQRKAQASAVNLPSNQVSDDTPAFDVSRAKREAYEAELAGLKVAELQGSLIRVDAVRSAWAAKITGARDALLQIPSRLAPVLAAESDLVSVTGLLEGALRQALADMSAEVDA